MSTLIIFRQEKFDKENELQSPSTYKNKKK